MALNIRTQIEKKPSANTMTHDFMLKHHITLNEPTQNHFSVEGVQTYSPEEIKAIKLREEKTLSAAQKDGTYIPVQNYKIEINPSATSKINKNRPESAKPIKNDQNQSNRVKPSIRNALGRVNQKMVKLDKEQVKKEQLQQKLNQLTKKYKQHFGEDLKPTKKQAANKQKDKTENELQQNGEDQLEFKDDQGDQCLPQQPADKISRTIATRPGQKGLDDSFEQVEWEKKQVTPSNSRLSVKAYSERLGNAVQSLFD